MKLNYYFHLLILFFICWIIFPQGLETAKSQSVLSGEASGKIIYPDGNSYGTGKLIFKNTGGDATFTTICDQATMEAYSNVHCTGTNVNGWFSGGPRGYAVFDIDGQKITFQLEDGKLFKCENCGLTANLAVVDPSIFDFWNKENGENLTTDDYSQMTLPTDENWDEHPESGVLDTTFPTIDKVMGDVTISDPDKPANIWQKSWSAITGEGDWRNWEEAEAGQSIINQTSLKTGTGRALIQFKDGTKFILERDSKITFNAGGGFTIETGSGYMDYKKYGQKIILETRRGKFAIVGTKVAWDVDGDHIQFRVLEGRVEADPNDGREIIQLEAGKEVLADEFGMSGAMDFDANNSIERWQMIEEEIIAADSVTANTNANSGVNFWWWVIGAVVLVGAIVIVLIVIVAIFLIRKLKK